MASLSKRFGKRDVDITTAIEGKIAFKAARKMAFNIVVIDLKMSGMDGMGFLPILTKSINV